MTVEIVNPSEDWISTHFYHPPPLEIQRSKPIFEMYKAKLLSIKEISSQSNFSYSLA